MTTRYYNIPEKELLHLSYQSPSDLVRELAIRLAKYVDTDSVKDDEAEATEVDSDKAKSSKPDSLPITCPGCFYTFKP